MRVAQVEHHAPFLQLDLVADADYVQLACEPFGHARDGVLQQRARKPVQRGFVIAVALGYQLVAVDPELDAFRARWS